MNCGIAEEHVIMIHDELNWQLSQPKSECSLHSRIRQAGSFYRQQMSTWQQQRKGSTLLTSKYLVEESYIATVFTLVTRRNTILRAENVFRAEKGHMSTFCCDIGLPALEPFSYLWPISISISISVSVSIISYIVSWIEYAPKHRPQMQTWMSTWWKGATLADLHVRGRRSPSPSPKSFLLTLTPSPTSSILIFISISPLIDCIQ